MLYFSYSTHPYRQFYYYALIRLVLTPKFFCHSTSPPPPYILYARFVFSLSFILYYFLSRDRFFFPFFRRNLYLLVVYCTKCVHSVSVDYVYRLMAFSLLDCPSMFKKIISTFSRYRLFESNCTRYSCDNCSDYYDVFYSFMYIQFALSELFILFTIMCQREGSFSVK